MFILYQLNNVPFKITIFQFVRLNIRNSVEQLIYRHTLQIYPVTHDILVQFLESVVSIPSVNLPLVVLSIHLYHDEKYECNLYFLISQISHNIESFFLALANIFLAKCVKIFFDYPKGRPYQIDNSYHPQSIKDDDNRFPLQGYGGTIPQDRRKSDQEADIIMSSCKIICIVFVLFRFRISQIRQ